MRKAYKVNNFLWSLTFVILIVGLISLVSASSVIGEQQHGDVFYFVKKQLLQGIVLGLFLAWIIMKIDYRKWKKLAVGLLIVNILFVLLAFVPGFQVTGVASRRWIRLGPFSAQPSEFLKVTFILFVSALLARFSLKERRKILGKPFIWYLLMLAIIGTILIKQPSTGTLLVLGLSTLTMYFAAGMSNKQFFLLVLIGVLVLSLVISHSGYRRNRILSFLSAQSDPMGKGYQILQSLIGIGSGGIKGVGFGRSVQKFNYLPQSHTDAIFSIIAEEFGFIGSTFIIVLYSLFLGIGLQIAKNSPDKFGKFLALGLTTNVVFQAMINIGAMCKLLPITGIPLPFISYGGSALVTNLVSVGILSNIARQS